MTTTDLKEHNQSI